MDTPPGQRLPIAEAAAALGISEKTIRRRIKAGTLRAERVVTPQGHVWLVEVATPRVVTPGQPVQVSPDDRQLAMLDLTRTVANELTRSLSNRIEELTRENERLRQQLQAALEAPKGGTMDVEPTAAAEAMPEPSARRWWRFWG
jgi:excisionase family DNA binding protein